MTPRVFPATDLYGITASEFSLGRSNLDVAGQMLAAGIKIVQYREKNYSMRQKYDECVKLRDLCTRYKACFIVNDDIHLALAVGADGVHIGQDDLPPEKARQIIGDSLLLGLSTHTPEQADAVDPAIVDYIGVGPLFQTFTKKDVRPPVGLGYLDYVAARHKTAFVAIGGIKESNVTDVVRHGAFCICMVTEIVGAPDIAARVRSVRDGIAEARRGG